MELQVGENRVGITWESLFWFTVFTAVGTVAGGIAYAWLEATLPIVLPKNATTAAKATTYNPATGSPM